MHHVCTDSLYSLTSGATLRANNNITLLKDKTNLADMPVACLYLSRLNTEHQPRGKGGAEPGLISV